MKKIILVPILLCGLNVFSQISKDDTLKNVVIESQRIDVPFSDRSRTITVINNQTIENSPATNVADLLQQEAGVDIRRRGADGIQADVYIRGGSFEQVLVLIDGVAVEDPQTGHHTMNMMLPLEVIDHIEIIKGPGARIYGQNAFTGVINIVTKAATKNNLILKAGAGSFNRLNGEITGTLDLKPVAFQAHYSKNISDGYRYNTDYDNDNFYLKTSIKTKKNPINVLSTYMQRKFGANGFYASPLYTYQYEETFTNLVAVSTKFNKGNLVLKPKLFWRRNQDHYLFIRDKPEVYENLHTSNKIGGQLNAKYISKLGTTGAGLNVSYINLVSNNLGNRERTISSLFVEHKFNLLNQKLDVTPGVALTYFTDFKFHAFPGIDLGYKINNNWKVYANAGYTYRIPTYTDMYYSSPITEGSEELLPETAIAEELGVTYTKDKLVFSVIGFNRDAQNLIDYVKAVETDKFKATNIREVSTQGIETNIQYNFKFANQNQIFKIGYTYLQNDIKNIESLISKYTLNSIQNHLTASLDFSFVKNLRHTIVLKSVERMDGYTYNVLDAKLMLNIKQFQLTGAVNNIFDLDYTETSLVPMPGINFMFGLKFKLR